MSEDKRRTFTKEFKHKIVMLKFANTMKTKEICKMYDLDRQTIHRWVNEFNAKGMSAWEGNGVVPGDDLETQRRMKELEMENEILKKAEAYFAKKKIK